MLTRLCPRILMILIEYQNLHLLKFRESLLIKEEACLGDKNE